MSRRLIETWLPIAEIGIESLRERTPMTPFPAPNRLHVWWARRPLVASRAAILASLLPADADRERQCSRSCLCRARSRWMVARAYLEIRVAIPCDSLRRPISSDVLVHEKAGVVEDKAGHRLAFNGSINETAQGWTRNWESFHVFTDWADASDRRRVDAEEESFQRLWNDRAKSCLVLDIPPAVQDGLLRFLPAEGQLPARLADLPPIVPEPPGPVQDPPDEAARSPHAEPDPDDLRRLVWGTIVSAPTWPAGGERVGEATSIITPWPHQIRAFDRLYGQWPPRLLIADEVGLGKTIEAGLLLRQALARGACEADPRARAEGRSDAVADRAA